MMFHAPDVMFLPLAAIDEVSFGDLDAGLLARRIPDFVHQLLNQGQHGPTGMLELQTAPDEGPVDWVRLDEPLASDEAFDMLPAGDRSRAVVGGTVHRAGDQLHVEFHVFFAGDADGFRSQTAGAVTVADPVPGLLQIARRLARLLELPWMEPPKGLLTSNGRAFLAFLHGLDNAMLLSGDLQIEVNGELSALMLPFADALALDPSFGLALRVAHSTLAMALEDRRLDKADCQRFLDRCYSLQPVDGEGCVAVADQLSELGDDQRALSWLEHAASMDPPPARGLESLGILLAKKGQTIEARDLWLKGLSLDGHPDFFAHLARLYFSESKDLDGWDMVMRGLRRLRERAVRSSEWEDHERGAGVMLEYLNEHLVDLQPPEGLKELLLDLCGILDGQDRVDLGLCLMKLGATDPARVELEDALRDDRVTEGLRDDAVRALLVAAETDFERKFNVVADGVLQGRNPGRHLSQLRRWVDAQPEFWPALYLAAIARRRMNDLDAAVDLFEAALEISPYHPDILREMAVAFDERGNPKRAWELVDQAIEERPDDVVLYADRAIYLMRLGRMDEARYTVQDGLRIDPANDELRRLERQLGA